MNDLSWLIYFADVADGLEFAISVSIFVSAILIPVSCAVACHDYEVKVHNLPFKSIASWFFILVLLLIAIPSKTTIYAIVASEMGEEVLGSETASKAMKAVDLWLDRQIDSTK